MGDRIVATVGFTVAGLSVAAALLPWPGGVGAFAAVAALVGTAGFGLRRHGYLDRRVGASVAGLGGAGLTAIALYALVGPVAGRGGASPGIGPWLAAAGGTLTAVAAYADWSAVPRDRLVAKARAAATAAAVGVAGLLAIVVWSAIIGSLVPIEDTDSAIASALSVVALGLGTGTVALFYLGATDRGIGFIDLRLPGRRDAGYAVGGVIVMVGLNLGLSFALSALGIESAAHSVIRAAESDPDILLVFIPLSLAVVGPGEELLYRNVVQKSLYGVFSRRGAVVVASAIFAGVHVFAYSGPGTGAAATLTTLAVLFVLALVLGGIYERTRTLIVPAFVHGSFNAVAFGVTYAELTGLLYLV